MTVGRINPWLSLGLPMLACAGLQLLFAIPIRIVGLAPPEPIFALVPAFAWAAAGPSLAAPFAVLTLGVFLDLLLGGPLGLWPASLMAAHVLASFGRAFFAGQGILTHLAWYGGACAVAFAAAFILSDMEAGAAPSLLAVAAQSLATVALFPIALALTRRYEAADAGFR
jgi:rod shape-determining protein MreD